MKPTVSVTTTDWPSPSLTIRLVGSSVAKSRSSASASLSADQRIEHRDLARVGVAHDRDRGHEPPVARAGRRVALLADVLDALLELLDLVADDAPVRLELGLARSARADAALRARQVRPQPRQARQLVLELGQLDLQAALVRARVLGKDVEDQAAPIEHLDAEQALQRTSAGWAEISSSATSSVKPVSCLARDQLLRLALAHVPVRIDVAAVLPLGADYLGAGGVGQAGQLGERILGRPAGVLAGIDGDEERTLLGRRQLSHLVACVHSATEYVPARWQTARQHGASSAHD